MLYALLLVTEGLMIPLVGAALSGLGRAGRTGGGAWIGISLRQPAHKAIQDDRKRTIEEPPV